MLILTRKPSESLYIGDDIKITIVEIKGHQIRVGIDAPKKYRIYREEIYLAIQEENRKAAEGVTDLDALDSLAGLMVGGDDGDDEARKRRAEGGSPAVKSLSSSRDPEVVVRKKRGSKDESSD